MLKSVAGTDINTRNQLIPSSQTRVNTTSNLIAGQTSFRGAFKILDGINSGIDSLGIVGQPYAKRMLSLGNALCNLC